MGASKAALINFAEALYLDLRPRNLGVCLIDPGFVKTPLTDGNEFRVPHLVGAEEAADEVYATLPLIGPVMRWLKRKLG